LPGKSVRSITNASTAPSGTAMSVMPVAISSELASAVQKSASAKMNA
jgi:hypothetical protein